MPIYKHKLDPVALTVSAHPWQENGDHPEDDCYVIVERGSVPFLSEGRVVRYYRSPETPGHQVCTLCGNEMHGHGWIDSMEGGQTVCPGHFVVSDERGYFACSPEHFRAHYEMVIP